MKIREAQAEDETRVRALAQRLNEGALPAWRDPAPLLASMAQAEAAFFGPPSEDRVLLVCADEHDIPLGFAQAMMDKDFFSGEAQGHLLFLATDAAHEGRGIARRLVAAVGDWARARGATGLLLYVFATNEGARRAYHRFGFQEDLVKMVKPLVVEGEDED